MCCTASSPPFVSRMLLLLLLLLAITVTGNNSILKCKCSRTSTDPLCEDDGVCRLSSASNQFKMAVCIAMNHSTSGMHYACSYLTRTNTSPECNRRTTKSGQLVDMCLCAHFDFCNVQLWPPLVPIESSSRQLSTLSLFITATLLCFLLSNPM